MMLRKPLLRPPGAKSEKEFLALCIQCGQCMSVCPYQSLRLHDGFGIDRHTPKVDPSSVPCYLCMKCPPVCPTGALDPSCTETHKASMGQAYIIEKDCHNFNGGIMCSTCYDRCPLRGDAIVLDMGFIPRPTDACVGCGVCTYVCPVKAVKTEPLPNFAPQEYVDVANKKLPASPIGALPILPAPKKRGK